MRVALSGRFSWPVAFLIQKKGESVVSSPKGFGAIVNATVGEEKRRRWWRQRRSKGTPRLAISLDDLLQENVEVSHSSISLQQVLAFNRYDKRKNITTLIDHEDLQSRNPVSILRELEEANFTNGQGARRALVDSSRPNQH